MSYIERVLIKRGNKDTIPILKSGEHYLLFEIESKGV